MIARSPRAPVPRSSANSAIASIASSVRSRSTPSNSKSLRNCRTSAFFGSTRIRTRASLSSGDTDAIIGSRPMNSGIRPNLCKSSGRTSANGSTSLRRATSSLVKPSGRLPIRSLMIRSSPAKAPPTMNSTLVVSIWMKSWCGCLRPPCGGTDAVVPSRIFSSACCTPSPETSRVIDGFSDFRATLSISSM